MQLIVANDPTGEYPEGSIIAGTKAQMVTARRVAALPVDSDLLLRNSASGYFKRSWGIGWKFDAHRSERGCPVVLFLKKDFGQLHWCARLVPDKKDSAIKGHLKMATDSGQEGCASVGLTSDAIDVKNVRDLPPDPGGGYIISGTERFTALMEAFVGLCLYGALDGARVQWLAVSQTK